MKPASFLTGFHFLSYGFRLFEFYSDNWKLIGIVNLERTARPDCLPGVHLGTDLITLTASSSQPNPTDLITSTFWIEPSVFTTN